MSEIISDFIKAAQAQSVERAVRALGLQLVDVKGRPLRDNEGGPCPVCHGTDRFSVTLKGNAWNCRNCGTGGRNGLGLVGHVGGYDLHSRSGLLEACSLILSQPIPEEAQGETPEERDDRQARMRKAREDAEHDAADRAQKGNDFREREVRKARGIFHNATMAPHPDDGPLRAYLRLRTGFEMADAVFENIRFDRRHTYWHGQDGRGNPLSHYVGFAMIAPFVDLGGHVTGCHETWISLENSPKFRPFLGLDNKGEVLPTKKMRGTKKGSVIPVCGDLAAFRWVGGEGIETVAAVAGYERFRRDTFYFAAGDLGNLAGPADPKHGFRHPDQTVTDSLGRVRAVRLAGPVPRPGLNAQDAIQLPDHVRAFVALADGDSEFFFTANAMARMKARFQRPDRAINIWWPPKGTDWAGLLSERRG